MPPVIVDFTEQIPSEALVISNFNNITTTLCTSTYLLWCEGQEGIMDPLFLCGPLPYYCSSKPIQLVTKGKPLPQKSWDGWDAARPLQVYASPRTTAARSCFPPRFIVLPWRLPWHPSAVLAPGVHHQFIHQPELLVAIPHTRQTQEESCIIAT